MTSVTSPPRVEARLSLVYFDTMSLYFTSPRILFICLFLFASGVTGCNAADEVAVQSGAYRFVWEPDGDAYSAKIIQGTKTVAQLPSPFSFLIADGQHRVACSGNPEKVRKSGNGVLAQATLRCANGARLRSSLLVKPETGEPAGFTLQLKTTVASAVGDGVAQTMRFTLPAAARPEALIPGVWYKRNEHVEDCVPSLTGGASLHVREDRATYPAVSLRAGTTTISLFREGAAAFDALPASDGAAAEGLFAGNALYTAEAGGTDVAGIGFDLTPAAPALAMHYPYYEGPYSMQLKVYAAEATPIFDPFCRYEDVQGVMDWELARKGRLNTTWRLVMSEPKDFGALLSDHWKAAYSMYAPPPRKAPDDTEVRNALAAFVASNYDQSSNLAGFFYVMSVPSATVLVYYLEPGFTGRTFLNARLLLEAGRELGRGDWVAMAESVYDTWITAGTQGGYFYDLWDVKRNVATNEKKLNALPDGFALRREAETVWALLEAVRDEERLGVARPAWREAVRAHLDGLQKLAQADGSFCRRYSFSGRCLEPNPGGTSSVVPALIHGYRMFGDARYLETAAAATRFIAEHFIEPADYFASTIDNPSENKEAATYAFYAARLMCEERCKTEPEWLALAQQAADASLTWIQMTDVPFYLPTPLARIGFETRGLGSVAAGGGNLDAYAFEFPGSLAWLARETGDERYGAMSRLILGAAMDTVALEGNMHGLSKVGMAPEGIQKTMFSFFMGGKGSYAPFSALGWTTASVYQTMDEVERVTGMPASEYLRAN